MPDEEEGIVSANGENDAKVLSEDDLQQSPEGKLVKDLVDPPPQVKQFLDVMVGAVSTRVGGRNPLLDKLTHEQVDKYLDHGRESEREEYLLRRSDRWFRLGYAVAGCGLFVFLVMYLLPTSPAMLDDIIKLAIGFAGGYGLGYGVRGHRQSS